MIRYDPKIITATMKLVVTGEFYYDEASEETLRYHIEQDLEDAGYEVDVSLLKEQEPVEPGETRFVRHYSRPGVYADLCLHCEKCGGTTDDNSRPKFCPYCGRKVKW